MPEHGHGQGSQVCPARGQFDNNRFYRLGPTNACSDGFRQDAHRIARGGPPNAAGMRCLKAMGFTHIIDLRRPYEINEGDGPHEPALARHFGINHHNFPTSPHNAEMNEARMLEVVQYVQEILRNDPNANIYIHCRAGQDRTGSFVAAIEAILGGCSWQQVTNEMAAFHFHPRYTSLSNALKNIFNQRHLPGVPPVTNACPIVSGRPEASLPDLEGVCQGECPEPNDPPDNVPIAIGPIPPNPY